MSVKEEAYESLKLGNQLCFPLYACSKEIIRKYKPFLDALDLTYTQYITMMVMWEKKSVNVKTGLLNNGFTLTTDSWLAKMEKAVKQNEKHEKYSDKEKYYKETGKDRRK